MFEIPDTFEEFEEQEKIYELRLALAKKMRELFYKPGCTKEEMAQAIESAILLKGHWGWK